MYDALYSREPEIEACNNEEHCALYLSFLKNINNEDSPNIKKCMLNVPYCRRHQLIDHKAWQAMTKEEKLKAIEGSNLFIRFINSEKIKKLRE